MSFSLINSINGLGKEDFISNEDPNLAVGKPWFVCLPSSVSRTGEAFQTTEPGLWWTCSSLSDIQTPYTPWKRLKSVRHFEPHKCARRQAEACTHALCATGHLSVLQGYVKRCTNATYAAAEPMPMRLHVLRSSQTYLSCSGGMAAASICRAAKRQITSGR